MRNKIKGVPCPSSTYYVRAPANLNLFWRTVRWYEESQFRPAICQIARTSHSFTGKVRQRWKRKQDRLVRAPQPDSKENWHGIRGPRIHFERLDSPCLVFRWAMQSPAVVKSCFVVYQILRFLPTWSRDPLFFQETDWAKRQALPMMVTEQPRSHAHVFFTLALALCHSPLLFFHRSWTCWRWCRVKMWVHSSSHAQTRVTLKQ